VKYMGTTLKKGAQSSKTPHVTSTLCELLTRAASKFVSNSACPTYPSIDSKTDIIRDLLCASAEC